MILYGEDRITPAKSGDGAGLIITTRYQKTLWHFSVWKWCLDDCYQRFAVLEGSPFIPYGRGLQLVMDLLRRKRNTKQTNFHGRKTELCSRKDGSYYMNSNGLDEYIVDKCYSQAQQARKLHIPITTFILQMIRICSNLSTSSRSQSRKSFYTGLKGLSKWSSKIMRPINRRNW
jgi:hypothetical protein